MQGHNVIENRLVDFDQKAGGQPIAFGLGKTTQGMDIVANLAMISFTPVRR